MQPVKEMLGLIRNVPCTIIQTDMLAARQEDAGSDSGTCPAHPHRQIRQQPVKEMLGLIQERALHSHTDRNVSSPSRRCWA